MCLTSVGNITINSVARQTARQMDTLQCLRQGKCTKVTGSIYNLDRSGQRTEMQPRNKTIKQETKTTRKLCYRKDDRAMRAIYVDREPLRRYGHSKLSKMAAAAILNLFESKIAPLDPPSTKTLP